MLEKPTHDSFESNFLQIKHHLLLKRKSFTTKEITSSLTGYNTVIYNHYVSLLKTNLAFLCRQKQFPVSSSTQISKSFSLLLSHFQNIKGSCFNNWILSVTELLLLYPYFPPKLGARRFSSCLWMLLFVTEDIPYKVSSPKISVGEELVLLNMSVSSSKTQAGLPAPSDRLKRRDNILQENVWKSFKNCIW